MTTFTQDIRRLFDAFTADNDGRHPTIIIANINALNLGVHISTESILLHANLLAIPETWVEAVALVR